MTLESLTDYKDSASRLGAEGELFVLRYEKSRLPEYMHPSIVHYAQKDIAMGYDILSFETPESVKPNRYIEVKTYRGHKHFYWSEGEITMARFFTNHYYLYLVDYDRIKEPHYEPEIICNPTRLFDMKMQWLNQPTNYVFSQLSPENIPADWFESIVLLGCYNTQTHLQWILSHQLYNVRACSRNAISRPGEVSIDDPRVQQARYLLLYQTGYPQNFMLFELAPTPRTISNNEMQSLHYTNPHASQYILHPILRRLPDFYVNLQQLFREALPKIDNAKVGQPLYLSGRQLTDFIPQRIKNENYPEVNRHNNLILEKRGKLWDEQEDNQLMAHLHAHLPLDVISVKMFRTPGAIRSRMRRLNNWGILSDELYRKYIPNPQPPYLNH